MLKNVDLNKLTDFLKIVEVGNITRAAEAMGEGKAKLSRNLALLEEDLGVRLVHRTTRQFRLTDVGLRFYKEIKEHLGSIDDSIQSLKAQDEKLEGLIRLTAPEDLGTRLLTPLVSDFHRLHPKTDFQLIYTNEVLDLVKLGIDVAFRIGNLKDSSMISKKVGRITFLLTAAPDYLDRQGSPQSPEDLSTHQTISFSSAENRAWKLESRTNTVSVSPKATLRANNFSAVLDLCLAGHGIALLPNFLAAPHLQSGKLLQVLKEWQGQGTSVQIAMPNQKKVPARVRQFFDFAGKRISEKL